MLRRFQSTRLDEPYTEQNMKRKAPAAAHQQRFMLHSKIRGAMLTGTELHYEGSVAVDRSLLELADMLPGEQVDVLNLNNGSRITTYIIEAPARSGTVLLNGPAARMGQKGDSVVLLTYCLMPESQARSCRPKVIRVNRRNQPVPAGAGSE
jgi:aspartate 1-decarboxylase